MHVVSTTCPLGHDIILIYKGGDIKIGNATRHCSLESHLTVASIMSILLSDHNQVAVATFYRNFALSKCFIGSRADEFYVHIARRRTSGTLAIFCVKPRVTVTMNSIARVFTLQENVIPKNCCLVPSFTSSFTKYY